MCQFVKLQKLSVILCPNVINCIKLLNVQPFCTTDWQIRVTFSIFSIVFAYFKVPHSICLSVGCNS